MLTRKVSSVGLLVILFAVLPMCVFDSRAAGNVNDAPYLSITPTSYVAKEAGEHFDIFININDVEDLRRISFAVTYNASLLSFVQAIQGEFFPPPPRSDFSFEGTLGKVQIDESLAASEPSRSGNGTLAVISFEVVPTTESRACSPVELTQILLLDADSHPISHNAIGALFFWKSIVPDPPSEGRVLDLYTQRGGQGSGQSGGVFEIGEDVELISRVTYNGLPVQGKLVGIEVHNPLDEIVALRIAITGPDGLSRIRVRIPVVLTNNGTWTVIGTVDLAGQVVWDTLTFQVVIRFPVGGFSHSIEERTIGMTPCTMHSLALTLPFFLVVARHILPRRLKSDRHNDNSKSN